MLRLKSTEQFGEPFSFKYAGVAAFYISTTEIDTVDSGTSNINIGIQCRIPDETTGSWSGWTIIRKFDSRSRLAYIYVLPEIQYRIAVANRKNIGAIVWADLVRQIGV